MLITDKNKLKSYITGKRLWQGVPSIAVTSGGRIFCTFYSGGLTETIGNYVLLVKSDDGENFSEPIVVCFKEGDFRCFDPQVWIDPLRRLWLTWSCNPGGGVFGAICENPDADEIVFGEEFFIGPDVMMNKPTVLSTGEWLFPIAIWPQKLKDELLFSKSDDNAGAYVYKTVDNGKTFEKLGGATEVQQMFFCEHMLLEHNDGRLANYIRTEYGIAVSYSYDSGRTWLPGVDSTLGGPNSRFHIRRLNSGRILLINHHNFRGRNNLTAFLSEDDGKTWPYQLLIDERDNVSYPDSQETDDGYIHITYDRCRGNWFKTLEETYAQPREILYTKITENDIIAGKLVSSESKMKCIVSKLGKYDYENENPFDEGIRYSDCDLADLLLSKHPDNVIGKLFEYYPTNCIHIQKLMNTKLDDLISEFEDKPHKDTLLEIIAIIRSVTTIPTDENPVIDRVKEILSTNITSNLSTKEIAEKAGISAHYLVHLFKQLTGITVTEYKNQLKLSMAKRLLIDTDDKLTDIAVACGFCSSSYLSEVFMRYEKISPSQYREYLKKNM